MFGEIFAALGPINTINRVASVVRMHYIGAGPAATVPSSDHWGGDSDPVTKGTASTRHAAVQHVLPYGLLRLSGQVEPI